jgi:hypothetical protein
MRRRIVGVALAAALVGGVVGVAAASIPDSGGVIHSCYKTNNPNRGQVIVIDTDAGQACSSGYTALNWNKSAATGYEVVQTIQSIMLDSSNGWTGDLFVDCPVGKVAVGGGAQAGYSGMVFLSGSYPDSGLNRRWHVRVREDPDGNGEWTNTVQVDMFVACVSS